MEKLIPIVAIVMGLGIPMLSMYLSYRRRELFHRERLAAAEKGLQLPEPVEEDERPKHPSKYLLHGLVWLFVGVGIAGFFWGISSSSAEGDFPSGIVFLGLIPAGVGLAQILFYFLKGAELNEEYRRRIEKAPQG